MASSGTEVHWAELGLGKEPRRRRRWAWAKEEKVADETGTHGWRDDSSVSAPSPELLEDFRRAQQHLPSLEWEPQAGGQQDSESGESAGEEIQAEDVDNPASATLPLYWFPQQDHQSDRTEEEQGEALGSPQEVKEAGENTSRLGYQAVINSEDSGSPSSPVLGPGKARSWVASDSEAEGDNLSEHSEVSPSVDLCSARSWSSGTVNLGHASDSLDSTWEGETDVPQPTPLSETSPQNPSCHPLNPDDRTRGSVVAQATLPEFHDSSLPPTQGLQCPGGGWRGATSLSHPQPIDQSWKRTKIPPRPLPSRFTGSPGSMNPQPRPARPDNLPKQRATLAGRSSSDTCKYGRGRLNYPLPDFSKVGPRVRFPKDESYRPPKAKSHSWQPQDPARPLIFKSPAEIVREVLLSSEEAPPAKNPPPAHPITTVPQEFQTPEQATKLVHQLQEDYHKLLTKYAEAENTIDQLRLGAKVSLYSDPPQPSHSVHMGTVAPGTKVLSFTIPQPRTAEWQPGPREAPLASEVSGWQSTQGDLSPSSPTRASNPRWPPENQSITEDQPSPEQTQALTSQASQFLAQVESFECLVSAGCLTPQDQLKGFQGLKAAHAALEEEYLKACRDQHLAQQPTSSEGTPGKFDPGRELAEEIFQLGNRLEEFKDHMVQQQQDPETAGPDSTLGSSPTSPTRGHPLGLPGPSSQGLTPAIQKPFPEPHTTVADACSLHVDVEASSISSELEGRPQELPAPLRHKELQMEQDFHNLLERCISVKSLPEALKEEEGEQGHALEVDGPAPTPGTGETSRLTPRHLQRQTERSHGAPLNEPVEQVVSMKPSGFHKSMARDGRPPGLGKAKTAPPGRSLPHPPRPPKSAASQQSSMTSLVGSGISERLPQKSLCHTSVPHLEEPWMASPETDSGFVGSETSRVSPVTHSPEHRLTHISTPGTSAWSFAAPVPQDGTSHSQPKGAQAPRTAAEPSMPRRQAQRHLNGMGSPHQHEVPSFRLERMASGEMGPSLEFQGRKKISEQLLSSWVPNPPPTPAHGAAPQTPRPTETTPSLLLTRTGRDQAIRELREEVSRLRLRLEDALHQPSQGSPTRPASSSNRPTQARDRPADSSVAGGTHYASKSTERLCAELGDAEQVVLTGRRRARSSSVPREVPQLSVTSESEPPSPGLFSEKSRTSKDSPRAARDRGRGGDSTGRPDRATFWGQYTGQEYHVLAPKTVQRGGGTVSCPHCQPVRTQDLDGGVTRDAMGPSPPDTPWCPTCHRVVPSTKEDGTNTATSGGEKTATRRSAPSSSNPKQRSKQAGSPARPPPGWYLAAMPPGPAFAYISPVSAVPCPPATVYYVPPGPTSTRAAEDWPPTASSRPAAGHQPSVQLDLASLEELNRALNRAVQAAKSVRLTTKQMSRSLSADLRQARGLRGSCLF
ncbi:microtubule organization protein AKNA [Rhynchocyon petersi]